MGPKYLRASIVTEPEAYASAQSVLNRLILVFATSGGQSKVVNEENEDVLRILDPWQRSVPLIGSAHSEMKSLPFLLLGVGKGDWSLHDDMEQSVTLLRDLILRGGR